MNTCASLPDSIFPAQYVTVSSYQKTFVYIINSAIKEMVYNYLGALGRVEISTRLKIKKAVKMTRSHL